MCRHRLRECPAFAVAHRLSTFCRADHILLLEQGKIEEQGVRTIYCSHRV